MKKKTRFSFNLYIFLKRGTNKHFTWNLNCNTLNWVSNQVLILGLAPGIRAFWTSTSTCKSAGIGFSTDNNIGIKTPLVVNVIFIISSRILPILIKKTFILTRREIHWIHLQYKLLYSEVTSLNHTILSVLHKLYDISWHMKKSIKMFYIPISVIWTHKTLLK